MRYAAKWLGLVAATAVMMLFAENPSFFKETGVLMPAALTHSAEGYSPTAAAKAFSNLHKLIHPRDIH